MGGGDTPGLSALTVVHVALGTPVDRLIVWVTGYGSYRCPMMSTPNC